MSDNLLGNDTKPANVPEKFWDAKANQIRTDALLKSYAELERKLSTMVAPTDTTKMQQIMGVPAQPQDYQINCDHGYFAPDTNINAQLHQAGFTAPQAQLVYDLAAEYLVPMIMDVANQYQSAGEMQRLENEFGPDRWPEVARQLQAWSGANLHPDAARGLSTTYDGVMAMHRMMSDAVGADSLPPAQAGSAPAQQQDIASMMRDPRYWQKRDPKYVAQVTAAFQRQYGAQA